MDNVALVFHKILIFDHFYADFTIRVTDIETGVSSEGYNRSARKIVI